MNDGYQGVLIVVSVIYFVPAIVAIYRHHRNRVAISVTNLLLGGRLLDGSLRLYGPARQMSKVEIAALKVVTHHLIILSPVAGRPRNR